jgi:iron complex outermembrane recepter protein
VKTHVLVFGTLSALLWAGAAQAQRAADNAVTSAQDAFGTTVGNESIGLYSTGSARGFSPTLAGNIRLEGLYFDRQGNQGNYDRLFASSSVHVGLSAQSYPFPAPTGIADFKLRIPGDKQVTSVVATIGPYDQYYGEVDTQIPLVTDKLSLGAGVGYLRTSYDWGSDSFTWTGGAVARWTPTDNFELIPFWTKSSINDWEVRPFLFTAGAYTPPKFSRLTYFGQPYNDWEENDSNFGFLARTNWDNWTFRLGMFRSLSIKPEDALIFYFNSDRDGLSDVSYLSNPLQRAGSYSGEARASGVFVEGPRRHTIHINARGRDTKRMFGGGDLEAVGKLTIGVFTPIPRPNFVYTASNRDHVKQQTGGIAYEGLWSGVGELSFGLQKTHYVQNSVRPVAGTTARTKATPWLYNGTLAIYATEKLALYASYTKGLEESGTAPDNATNRGAALPASITKQIDAGARYAITPSLKLVAGVYEVKKPFFDRDPTALFTRVGGLTHRGIELSLAGKAAEGLTVVAGAVILQARTDGILVDQGFLGRVPGGRPPLIARINAQYGPAAWDGFSIDGQYEYTIQGYSDPRDILKLSPYNQINLGARYRFKAFEAPATLRVQILNITNTWGWSSGGNSLAFFQYLSPRRVIASITADF